MVYKLTFHHPYFHKLALDFDGKLQSVHYWENLIRGVLVDDTNDFVQNQIIFVITRATAQDVEMYLVYPDNVQINLELLDRLVESLNTPYDETLMSRLVNVRDFTVEVVSRTEFMQVLSTHRIPVCFLNR